MISIASSLFEIYVYSNIDFDLIFLFFVFPLRLSIFSIFGWIHSNIFISISSLQYFSSSLDCVFVLVFPHFLSFFLRFICHSCVSVYWKCALVNFNHRFGLIGCVHSLGFLFAYCWYMCNSNIDFEIGKQSDFLVRDANAIALWHASLQFTKKELNRMEGKKQPITM